jgi:peptidoglycan/LPS O-acetylase OafA/YrhL
MSCTSSIEYRPEIDGLRALAVVPVILFHAGLKLFEGGYVGVDVFFVISGYLITALIVAEKESGKFSIITFYERRARRILPALFVVVIVCLPLALFWMTPEQLRRFSHSVVATSMFASNFLFWYTSGYFDTAAEEKPLLHTWSLGVEEQFYMFFPLLVLALYRVGTARFAWILLSLCFLSFGLSEVMANYGSATANFFLTSTRAWELLLGSVTALSPWVRRFGGQLSVPQKNLAACGGMGLICLSIFSYDKSTPTPSLYTLGPTVGTALILAFADEQTLVARLLSLPQVVGVGLISYSAYLWHQPLFAFMRIYNAERPSTMWFLTASVLALGVAYLSWRFIERPFRDKGCVSKRSVLVSSVVGSLGLVGVGLAGHLTNGCQAVFEARLNDEQRATYAKLEQAIATGGYTAMYDNSDCKFWDRTVSTDFLERYGKCAEKYGRSLVVVGDSHAMDLYNSLASTSTKSFIVGVAQGGCRPHDHLPECHYDRFRQFVNTQRETIDVVFYTQSGGHFLTKISNMPFSRVHVGRVHDYLRGLSQMVPVIWFGPQAELAEDVRSINPLLGKYVPNFRREIEDVDEFLEMYLAQHLEPNIAYLSILKLTEFKPNDFYVEGAFTYSDSDHWSSHGERIFGSRLATHPAIEKFFRG